LDAADGGDPRTFLGFIDEVQVTSGVVPDGWQIGKIPSVDAHPQNEGVSAETNGVGFQWAGAAATNFLVQWVPRLGGRWTNHRHAAPCQWCQ
jgi:hypothetical protein